MTTENQLPPQKVILLLKEIKNRLKDADIPPRKHSERRNAIDLGEIKNEKNRPI